MTLIVNGNADRGWRSGYTFSAPLLRRRAADGEAAHSTYSVATCGGRHRVRSASDGRQSGEPRRLPDAIRRGFSCSGGFVRGALALLGTTDRLRLRRS
jgi:hypothetical protein